MAQGQECVDELVHALGGGTNVLDGLQAVDIEPLGELSRKASTKPSIRRRGACKSWDTEALNISRSWLRASSWPVRFRTRCSRSSLSLCISTSACVRTVMSRMLH